MSHQILKSKIKEQVENKVNPILKERYHEDIAIKLFKSSSEIIRDSIDEVTKNTTLIILKKIKKILLRKLQYMSWNGKVRF
jgi:hypothetical protein